MKGRQILIEPLKGGGDAAALMVDGRLEDLLIDPDPSDLTPRPEAIYRAIAARPMKGLGGAMVDLGNGRTGFLRGPRLPAAGRPVLVQVSGWAEPEKAPLIGMRLRLKGRTVMLTPGAPGRNVARSLRDSERREWLVALAATAMAGAAEDLGLVLRSAAATAPDDEIAEEIRVLLAECAALARVGEEKTPALLRPAPGAAVEAEREWRVAGDSFRRAATALADAGVWEDIEALRRPLVPLGQGTMAIEPTRALVSVDVNTGSDVSGGAPLRTNLAAAAELPRQLRLRGLGGQVTIDFAPLAHGDRPRVEQALASALRNDGIETTIVGWTPLGHLELQRKRARRPLSYMKG